MRFYLNAIQYNKNVQAENRSTPKAYNTLTEALVAYHKGIGSDMSNNTLSWVHYLVWNSAGGIHINEKWEEELVSTPTNPPDSSTTPDSTTEPSSKEENSNVPIEDDDEPFDIELC